MTKENPQLVTATGNPIPGGPVAPDTAESTATVKTMEEIKATFMAPGVIMDSNHTRWFNGEPKGGVPSVTGILGILDKSGPLIYWAKSEVAKFAVETAQTGQLLAQIGQTGPEATAKWLASLPDYQRDTAANIGTSVHLLANLAGRDEKPAEGFQMPTGTEPYLQAFRGFLGHYSASNIISSEKHVFHLGVGYGGQYDLVMRIDGQLWLIDIKTGKGPRLTAKTQATGAFYPEAGLQLAGYKYAEFIGLPNDPKPYPMPLIQQCAVLHLRPDRYPDTGYRLIPYRVGDREWMAFISAFDLYQWRKEGTTAY